MAFPQSTRTGKNWKKTFLEMSLTEIEDECRHSYEREPSWLPMLREVIDYVFTLEERITELEES